MENIIVGIISILLFAYLLDRRVAVARAEDEVEYAAGLTHAQ